MGCMGSKEVHRSQDSAHSAPPESSPKPNGLAVLSPGVNPVVDIIFLHGLTGSRDKTWTADGSSESWLKTFLAKDFPNARIITFGYDAEVVHFTEPVGLNSIRDHTRNLLLEIGTLRKTAPLASGRPIIFVAHSLGGLVCQDAIFACQNASNASDEDILTCTCGVIYFGTPHAGSSLTKFADALANLVRLSLVKQPNRSMLDVLKRNSDMLANIENDFSKLVHNLNRNKNRTSPIELFVFVEELPVPLLARRVVEPDSAKIKGYDWATIAADHMGMTKFASRDNNYARFQGVLQDWIGGLDTGTVTENQNEPNDPALGSEKYYVSRVNVKYHIRRLAFLQLIDQKFDDQVENQHRIIILNGLGGQGKTQVAIDYCHRCHLDRRFYAIFFLDASSEGALQKGILGLTDILKSPGQIFDGDNERSKFVLEKIRSWNRRWLLVFDNYDNPKAFPGIQRFIPQSKFGHVIITSRHEGLEDLGDVVSVPPMSPEEATELLSHAAELPAIVTSSPETIECAFNIVKRLGYLPLAIHQAAAYIRRKSLPLEHFLVDYETRKDEIWSKKPKVWTYKGTVYTTWELSYDLVDETADGRSRKGAILTMLAFLDYRGISREMFSIPRQVPSFQINEDTLQLKTPPWLSELLRSDGAWDLRKLDEILDDFRELSLLQISDRSNQSAFKISLHPLVAEWIRYRAQSDKGKQRQCLFQASVLVAAAMEALTTLHVAQLLSEQAQQEVLKHQAACLSSLEEYRNSDEDATFVLDIDAMISMGPQFTTSSTRPSIAANERQSVPAYITSNTSSSSGKLPMRRGSQGRESALDVSFTPMLKQVQQLRDDHTFQKRQAILAWISTDTQEETYKILINIKLSDTCRWVFSQVSYQKWLNGEHRVLLCIAGVGSGKTIISAAIIEELRQTHRDDRTVAITFFFCGGRELHASYETGILRALVQQLLTSLADIPQVIETLYDRNSISRYPPDHKEIFEALEVILKEFDRVYIVIDGFNEIPDAERPSVMRLLQSLEAFKSIHLLISSRGIPELMHWKAASPVSVTYIDMKRADNNIDLELLIDQRLSSPRFDRLLHPHARSLLREEVRHFVLGQPDVTFLYAKLLLDQIGNCRTLDDMQYVLKERTSGALASIYETMLEKIQSQDPASSELANIILLWLLASTSPLSVLELTHAVHFSEKINPTVDADPDDLIPERHLVDLCQGLVVLDDATSTVALVHTSIRSWANARVPKLFPEKHARVASLCMAYLFQASLIGERINELFLVYPLLLYAAKSWPYHSSHQERPEEIAAFLMDRRRITFWRNVLGNGQISALQLSSGQVATEDVVYTGSPEALANALELPETAAWIAEHAE